MTSSREPDSIWRMSALAAALICAVLLISVFAFVSSATPMPPAERWAALTTFTLLTLAYTLQGSPGLYDALGQTVRRDWRAYAVLVALLPALYLAYSSAVGEFTVTGLGSAVLLALVPGVAFYAGRGQRRPVIFDWVATLYLWLSFALGLVPSLTLPQQGGLVGFFHFALVPLLLLALAARGWPGLGFTWFLRSRDLRDALLAGVVVAALAVFADSADVVLQFQALALLARVIELYFFVALPAELLYRGLIQNGISRSLAPLLPSARRDGLAPAIGAVVAALAAASAQLIVGASPLDAAVVALAALGYGWVYTRSGKITASAVAHALVLWIIQIM
jgi:membrane protease YdiL (CAAX protease family)